MPVLALPGLALLLAAGIGANAPVPASIAAGTAFSIGLGTGREVRKSRWLAMTGAAAAMTVAAAAGTLAGDHRWVVWTVVAGAGGVCGALGYRHPDLWWLWLQALLAFLLASAFGGDARAALIRAGVVAAGGFGQIAAVALTALVIPGPLPARTVQASGGQPSGGHEGVVFHAARAAACIGGATVAAHVVGLVHWYWAPFTAALVLKAGMRDTARRGLERALGTIAGIVLATAAAYAIGHDARALSLAVIVSAAAAFGLQRARYALFSAAVTATALLTIAYAGGQVLDADDDRLAATAIGAAIALLGAGLRPGLPARLRRRPLR